ncbi:hypothetical protein BDN72DRAFT_460900 [Pluteus cervinus]|uniref:Uncharacterized protein n=1 Tax=Pluteus cervinus TaxID=181527 RepID=A0ACD3A7Z1_9AGAR|nr:hypothetical protein BDN72DRAFT_460900 [Pluteus cervinus]
MTHNAPPRASGVLDALDRNSIPSQPARSRMPSATAPPRMEPPPWIVTPAAPPSLPPSAPPSNTPRQESILEPSPSQAQAYETKPNPMRLLQAQNSLQLLLGGNNDAQEVNLPSYSKLSQASPATGGFRLNYDSETPLRSVDFGGEDQEQKLAEFVTKGVDNLSHNLTVQESREQLNLDGPQDVLPGMEVRLLDHQAIGVAWMLEKERSIDRGGLLADDMGLGKTVQMIATMAMNLSKDEDCKTTLVVVPAALLQQWKDEFTTKTNALFEVHIHHGRDKLQKKSQVKAYDVIITSYQTLCQDFQVPAGTPHDEEAAYLDRHGGVLSRVKFYRAVADEAQFIRNRATRASLALAHVKAKYRWMLTGTPVTNTLADVYGLLRFGRFRPWNDWPAFNEHVARVQLDDAVLAAQRTQAILRPIIMRRTKNSTLEGKPILNLPPKDVELVTLRFSPEEQMLYDHMEKATKIQVNRLIKAGTVLKNHEFILELILRLRQLCCHPNLVLSRTQNFDDPALLVATDADRELGRARKLLGRPWVDQIKQKFLVRAHGSKLLRYSDSDDEEALANACPVCEDIYMRESGRLLTCGHEICLDCLENIVNAPVNHDGIFGFGNEKDNLAREQEYENAIAKGHRPCPTCKKMLDMSKEKTFKSYAFEPSQDELLSYTRAQRLSKRKVSGQRRISGSKKEAKSRTPTPPPASSPPRVFKETLSDDSDSDLPEISSVWDARPVKRQKKGSDDDELLDITMDDISKPLNSKKGNNKKTKAATDEEDEDEDEGGDSDTEMSDAPASSKYKGKRKAKANTSVTVRGKGVLGRALTAKNQDGPSAAMLETWSRSDDDTEASTKIVALVKYLTEWESTGDKTICYSQWTSMLNLIEAVFSRHGIRTLRFDGTMNRGEREEVLSAFRQPWGAKVILISTKSGSVGLNLVSANRIINMDLSWNYASESQAYDRCHRIGQEKNVYVKRLIVENTIEERMLKLQDVKVGLAEAALGEGTGARLHKLSVKDIKFVRPRFASPFSLRC